MSSCSSPPATTSPASSHNQGPGQLSRRPAERWVVIDPKAAAGTPARSAAELLWTRVDELPGPQAITGLLDTIVENGQLDHAKATAWAFVRSVDYWLWGLQNGLTTDPVRCQRVASALAPSPGKRAFRVQASMAGSVSRALV
jgi:hypothetical protein